MIQYTMLWEGKMSKKIENSKYKSKTGRGNYLPN